MVADQRLEDRGNFSFGSYAPDQVADMVRRVARAEPDAIAITCTNFRGAEVAAALEAEVGIPVIDSIAITAAQTMRLVGLDPNRVTGWGSVFPAYAGFDPAALHAR